MKTIKKIVALGLGASMVLGTVAAAADLHSYPAPFVSGGKFMGTLVVGDKAAAEDVIGVSDVAMSLQFAASVKAGSGAGAQTSVEGDAWLVKDTGNELNLYEGLSTVQANLDDEDLKALADGELRAKANAGYSQQLTLPAVSVKFAIDDDADVDDPAVYLHFPSGTAALTYKMDFSTPAESDFDSGDSTLEDFEDEKITLLGKEYTITQASNESNEVKLTLMAGAVQTTQEVGETKTYNIDGKDYEVTVMVVSGDDSDTAVTKLIVNDEVTQSLSKDDTYTLKDGTEIGIKEVLPTKAGDVQQNLVEFFLGAQKMVLDGSSGQMEISEEDVDDVAVTVSSDGLSDGMRVTQIQLVWTPDEDYYVPVGGRLSEFVSDNEDYVSFLDKLGVDYSFAGLAPSNTETLEFVPSGDSKYKIEFTNRKNVDYSEDVFYYNGTAAPNMSAVTNMISLGKDASDALYVAEGDIVCDGHRFVTEYNKNTRILEFTDHSSTDSQISVKDRGDKDTRDYSYSLSAGSNYSTINLDGAAFIVKVMDNHCLLLNDTTDSSTGYAHIWTKYDTKVRLRGSYNTTSMGAGSANDSNIVITEDSDGQDDDDSVDTMSMNFTYSTTDSEIQLSSASFASTMAAATAGTVMISLDSDDNTNEGVTEWGNWLKQTDTDGQDKWAITLSENEANPLVYVTAGVTTIMKGDDVSGDTVIIQKIEVGATKLASEIAGLEKGQNLLLVGGPCANRAVEAASAEFPTCSGWGLAPGEALVQLVNQADGHVALLVAGTTAADTRAATKMVAEQKNLQALKAGVVKQVLTVSTGTLMDMKEPEAMVDTETQ